MNISCSGVILGIFLGPVGQFPSSSFSSSEHSLANECSEEEKDEEGNCPTGPKKMPKITPEQEIFTTTYYEFPGNFTANLKGSKKFLQISVGVSTQYDEQVMAITCSSYWVETPTEI